MPDLAGEQQLARVAIVLGAQTLSRMYADWIEALVRYCYLTKELEESTHA